MPRDFKSKSSKNVRRTKPSKTPTWVGFLFVLVIVAALAGLFYWHQHEHRNPIVTKTTHLTKLTKHAAPTLATQNTTPAPHFEFYNMLSKDNSTESATAPETVPQKKTTAPNTKVQSSNHYVLQIAAFKDYKPADELKAKLALVGVDANIETLNVDNAHWYRVIAGPYPNETSTEHAKAAIQKAGYTALIKHSNN